MGLALALIAAGLAVSPLAFVLAVKVASRLGWWRLSRRLGRLAPRILGEPGRATELVAELVALRESGRLRDAVALAALHLRHDDLHPGIRNLALDIMISAGAYTAALASAGSSDFEPRNRDEALNLALIQINLAEAEYNLGRWDAAEQRLRVLDAACRPFPICWAGLLLQRAWIAAHAGLASEALAICAAVDPTWFPRMYRAEYHFARAVALLALDRADEADAALTDGAREAKRLSSRRNLLFLRAQAAAARGDWGMAEQLCRTAADHPFRGQGGGGLLLWSEALGKLGRDDEAGHALRLALGRDPESEAAAVAARRLGITAQEDGGGLSGC